MIAIAYCDTTDDADCAACGLILLRRARDARRRETRCGYATRYGSAIIRYARVYFSSVAKFLTLSPAKAQRPKAVLALFYCSPASRPPASQPAPAPALGHLSEYYSPSPSAKQKHTCGVLPTPPASQQAATAIRGKMIAYLLASRYNTYTESIIEIRRVSAGLRHTTSRHLILFDTITSSATHELRNAVKSPRRSYLPSPLSTRALPAASIPAPLPYRQSFEAA
jgi:hypothetical protein